MINLTVFNQLYLYIIFDSLHFHCSVPINVVSRRSVGQDLYNARELKYSESSSQFSHCCFILVTYFSNKLPLIFVKTGWCLKNVVIDSRLTFNMFVHCLHATCVKNSFLIVQIRELPPWYKYDCFAQLLYFVYKNGTKLCKTMKKSHLLRVRLEFLFISLVILFVIKPT